MWKCNKCGTEFEGTFCPECGTKREEERTCPQCGAALPAGAKFCPECGAKPGEGATLAPAATGAGAEKFRKAYRALAVAPAALCALFSLLLFLFCLAPSSEMLDIFLGGTTALGNVYDLNDACSQTIVAFAAIGLALAGATALFLFLPRLKWREIGRRIPVWGALNALTFAVYLSPFAAACAICADVARTDGGLGVLTVGAGPILIAVFSSLGLLLLVGAGCARYLIGRKYPALAEEERAARDALAEQYEAAKPARATQLLMRLRTAMREKTFLRWSIPFTVISTILLAALLGGVGAELGHGEDPLLFVLEQFGDYGFIFWFVAAVLALGVGGFCFGVLFSKKVRIPSLDLKKTLEKSQKWFRGACIAYSIVGTIDLALTIAVWKIVFQSNIDTLTLEAAWMREFLLFVTIVIFAVTLLDIAFSFSGFIGLKRMEDTRKILGKEEKIDLRAINAVAEERRAKTVRLGVPALVLAGFLLMTIVVVSGAGYTIFSPYKLDQIEVGDPYTTVTRTLGNPDEGRDTNHWTYYSEEYLSIARRRDELQTQMEKAKTEEEFFRIGNEITELENELAETEYRQIEVAFTPDGCVTSVTVYRILDGERQVEYQNPSRQRT